MHNRPQSCSGCSAQTIIGITLSGYPAWKPFLWFPLAGLHRLNTPISFAAPLAEPAASKPKRSGSIGDRQSIPKAIVVNGKSSTIANAALLGGRGVVIGHRQRLVESEKKSTDRVLNLRSPSSSTNLHSGQDGDRERSSVAFPPWARYRQLI